MEVSSKLSTAVELAENLQKNGFPCRVEEDTAGSIHPVDKGNLVEIGQVADADRDQLLTLTMWLVTSVRSCRYEDAIMADRGPLA